MQGTLKLLVFFTRLGSVVHCMSLKAEVNKYLVFHSVVISLSHMLQSVRPALQILQFPIMSASTQDHSLITNFMELNSS
jgi:hypothetical protein